MTPSPLPLTHRLDGRGSPVVLLNGGMMTIAAWEPVVEALRDRYEVLRFDFRGQLLSPHPESPADEDDRLEAHAADVVALLDRVGWASAHFIGVSFGAEVALALAASAPERLRSLCVITAMDRETEEFRRQSEEMQEILASVAAGGDRERFYRVMVENVYSPAYREAAAEDLADRRAKIDLLPARWFTGVSRLLDALRDFDLGPGLARHCPALALLAAQDRVMDETRALALAEAIGARVEIHPTAGHGLVIEDPPWVAAHCRSFLDRCEDGEAGSTAEADR